MPNYSNQEGRNPGLDGPNHIPYNSRMLKAELLQICKTQKPQPEYVLDNILRQHGHDCLRLPAYHADLNAIELVWAQVKGYMARQTPPSNPPA